MLSAIISHCCMYYTGSCTKYILDPTNTSSVIYVHQERTLCFICSTCTSQLAWNVTSHRGHSWTGTSGQLLQSSNLVPDRGEIFPNSTLLLINSSVVFSTLRPGALRFQELQGPQPLSSDYEVHLGGKYNVYYITYLSESHSEERVN